MNQTIEMQIEACEQRLEQAMLQSDITELDKLLAPDLIFTNHLGQIITKQDDLDAHRSGNLKIGEIVVSDQVVKFYGGIAVVSVRAYISGKYAGEASENNFRFARIWSKTLSGSWQIIAGHSSIVI